MYQERGSVRVWYHHIPRMLRSFSLSFLHPPGASHQALRPSLLASGPSQLALWPSQLARRPSQLALRPSQLAPRLTQLDPRPPSSATFSLLVLKKKLKISLWWYHRSSSPTGLLPPNYKTN